MILPIEEQIQHVQIAQVSLAPGLEVAVELLGNATDRALAQPAPQWRAVEAPPTPKAPTRSAPPWAHSRFSTPPAAAELPPTVVPPTQKFAGLLLNGYLQHVARQGSNKAPHRCLWWRSRHLIAPKQARITSSFIRTLGGILFMALTSSRLRCPMNILINKYREHAVPLICLSVLVCLFITSQITLRDFPNSADEYSYLISAKLFSAGRLSVPSPSHQKFYDFAHIINDGQFYGKYSPGWPFFLMFGEFLGFPWVINMIFAVLTLVVTYSLARELFSEKIAKISLLLMATNSYFLFNSSSYFSHTSSQFFLLLFVYFYLKRLKTEKSGGWFLLGIILGISFLIRQLEAVVFGFCIFIHYIYFVLRNKKACSGEIVKGYSGFPVEKDPPRSTRRSRREQLSTNAKSEKIRKNRALRGELKRSAHKPVSALKHLVKWGLFLSGFSLLFGIFLTYNYLQTGDPFLLPFIKYDPGDKLGFHYPYMTSLKSAIMDNIIYRIIHLNLWVPFCFVFMFLALFSSERYSKEYVYLMVTLFISILFAYFFYVFHPGNQYGPRYLYSSSFTIFILMAIGIEKIMTSKWYGYRWVLPGILTLNIGLFIYVSVLFANQVDMRMELYNKVKEAHISNAIVFLESPSGFMPVQDLTRNGIYFNNSVLFVKNFHQENRILMEDFPLRKYYLWRCEDRSINCTLKRIEKNFEVTKE